MWILIMWAFMVTVHIIPTWRILRKAGLMSALSLLHIVPVLGWLSLSLILAFCAWPALRRRASVASVFE
jgi:hypothetical protein